MNIDEIIYKIILTKATDRSCNNESFGAYIRGLLDMRIELINANNNVAVAENKGE